MARSNKYSRARIRAKVRRPKKRGGARWYYGALALIVAAGVTGIVTSAGGNDVHPLAGINPVTSDFYDHWHEALGVNVCGEWLSEPLEFHNVTDSNIQAGLHTHGDGFIHIHPYSSADAGDNATLGRYFHNGGWTVAEDSFDVWAGPAVEPGTTTWSNGDKCPPGSTMAGRTGVVKWSVDCTGRTGNPADYKLQDLHVVALAFLPKGEAIGVPPNAFEAPDPDAGQETPEALDVKSCSTAGPGGEAPTTTTSSATTSTTGPATATP
ncbi:MAG: hypothetical protein WEE69_01955 [Acidimicrobiia bacterium]